jgi:hypothetical protein
MYNVSLKFRVAPSVRPRRKSHVLAMFQYPSETLDDVRLRCPDDLAPIVDAIHVSVDGTGRVDGDVFAGCVEKAVAVPCAITSGHLP